MPLHPDDLDEAYLALWRERHLVTSGTASRATTPTGPIEIALTLALGRG